MGYQITSLSFEEAKERAEQYTYGLVYLFSEILLGKTENIKDKICWEDCMEARFFSEQGELHIFDYNGERRAVCVEDGTETGKFEIALDKSYPLAKEFEKIGYHSFKVREYLEGDADGQAVIVLTRLVELE